MLGSVEQPQFSFAFELSKPSVSRDAVPHEKPQHPHGGFRPTDERAIGGRHARTKKPATRIPSKRAFVVCRAAVVERLTLRELNATTSTTQTWLLTFLHTRVSRQEVAIAERVEILFVEADQCTSQAHANCTSLSGRAATMNADQNVDCFASRASFESLLDRFAILIVHEISFERFAVDRHLAAASTHTYAGDRGLAATCSKCIAVDLVFLYCNHNSVFRGMMRCRVGGVRG